MIKELFNDIHDEIFTIFGLVEGPSVVLFRMAHVSSSLISPELCHVNPGLFHIANDFNSTKFALTLRQICRRPGSLLAVQSAQV